MKQYLVLALLMMLYPAAKAQPFPQSFIGHWKGELLWYRQGQAEPKKVAMQLIVQPTDTAGQYTWQLIYGENKKDNRPYILKPVDSTQGHWTIDERNGIMLDTYWIGKQLASAFTVGGNTIINNYSVQDNMMVVEFRSFPVKPLANTGGTGKDIPPVDSYNIRSYQKAILQKVKEVKR